MSATGRADGATGVPDFTRRLTSLPRTLPSGDEVAHARSWRNAKDGVVGRSPSAGGTPTEIYASGLGSE